MPLFNYRAINQSGKPLKGKIEAGTIKQATQKLQAQELYIVSVSGARSRSITSSAESSQPMKVKKSSIPPAVITGFTRQFAILTTTGIPYDKALDIMVQESEHAGFQNLLSSMRSQIMEGSSLANALQTQPHIFSKMFVALVRAGEAGGTLGTVLERLAKSREESEALSSKIKGALIYPIIMLVVAVSIVIFMITFILPKIAPIFEQFDVQLPLPTRIVITLSDFFINHWLALIISFILLGFGFYKLVQTNRGEKIKDRLLLRTPLLGNVIRKVTIFRFTQTLGSMLSSGVELKQALNIIKHVMGNREYEDQFEQISVDITRKGMDLSHALRKTGLFPPMVTQMIRVGEESSKLEEMLDRIAGILEKEVRQTLEKAVAMLEPLTILWMATVVGFILLAIMLPMFEINNMI